MTITYCIGESLYINVTNRCTNACSFCIRASRDAVGDGDSLWFDGPEPSKEEIWADIVRRRPKNYKEIVFCGFGEPLTRFDDVIWICRKLKEAGSPPVRVNTNGHAALITGRDAAAELKGLVDAVSISLNAKDAAQYAELCRPVFGEAAYGAVLDFAQRCVEVGIPSVTLTVLDFLPAGDIEACRKMAEKIGARFRVRSMV